VAEPPPTSWPKKKKTNYVFWPLGPGGGRTTLVAYGDGQTTPHEQTLQNLFRGFGPWEWPNYPQGPKTIIFFFFFFFCHGSHPMGGGSATPNRPRGGPATLLLLFFFIYLFILNCIILLFLYNFLYSAMCQPQQLTHGRPLILG
jgi:hypothetical protein